MHTFRSPSRLDIPGVRPGRPPAGAVALRPSTESNRLTLHIDRSARGDVDPARLGSRGRQEPIMSALYTSIARSLAAWRFSFKREHVIARVGDPTLAAAGPTSALLVLPGRRGDLGLPLFRDLGDVGTIEPRSA